MKKTIERQLYIQVQDTPEGNAILARLVTLLSESRHDKAYLNGWMGPWPSEEGQEREGNGNTSGPCELRPPRSEHE